MRRSTLNAILLACLFALASMLYIDSAPLVYADESACLLSGGCEDDEDCGDGCWCDITGGNQYGFCYTDPPAGGGD